MKARLTFGSVCSGIEAASVAWHPLGWQAAWLAEIEPFPCAVLAHHYPDVPNLGDMTTISRRVLTGEVSAPDVFCGGTPCQAFSVAGLRQSLDDARGNLTLKFVEIADAIDHVRAGRGEDECIVFWENVPGVLSTKDNAFGCFLGGLAGEDGPLEPPGGKWANAGAVYGPRRAVAWRTLDAQYFGLAQRRRRVFVVASARKGFDPATVLFEWDGVRRDSAPSREAREVAPTIPARSTGVGGTFACGGIGSYTSASASATLLKSGQDLGPGCETIITMAHGQGGAEIGFDRGPTLTCNHEAPIAAYTINFCDTGGSRPDRRDGGLYVTETDTSGALTCAEATTKILQQVTRTSANGHGISPELAHTLDRAQGQCVAFDGGVVQQPTFCIKGAAIGRKPEAGPQHGEILQELCYTQNCVDQHAVAVSLRGREGGATAELGDEVQNCLRASGGGGDKPHGLHAMQVRRLTPIK